MQQYYRFKRQHPSCVLMFRIGDFYEMFDEDAVKVTQAIGLTLTQRTEGMPMCGVPYHQLETYLRRLILAGFRVAVCEQLEDPSKARGIVKRGVVRVLTPALVESPHWLVEQGRCDEAMAVLEKIARLNCRPPISGDAGLGDSLLSARLSARPSAGLRDSLLDLVADDGADADVGAGAGGVTARLDPGAVRLSRLSQGVSMSARANHERAAAIGVGKQARIVLHQRIARFVRARPDHDAGKAGKVSAAQQGRFELLHRNVELLKGLEAGITHPFHVAYARARRQLHLDCRQIHARGAVETHGCDMIVGNQVGAAGAHGPLVQRHGAELVTPGRDHTAYAKRHNHAALCIQRTITLDRVGLETVGEQDAHRHLGLVRI
jgi:hypothetical protein